jgi:hypothetical protein
MPQSAKEESSMPIRYSIEVINEGLLKAVLDAQIPPDEASALLRKVGAKQKRGAIGLGVCAGLCVLSGLVFSVINKLVAHPSDTLMIGLLAIFFVGVFGAIFMINSFVIARKYVKALKLSYPQIF